MVSASAARAAAVVTAVKNLSGASRDETRGAASASMPGASFRDWSRERYGVLRTASACWGQPLSQASRAFSAAKVGKHWMGVLAPKPRGSKVMMS